MMCHFLRAVQETKVSIDIDVPQSIDSRIYMKSPKQHFRQHFEHNILGWVGGWVKKF